MTPRWPLLNAIESLAVSTGAAVAMAGHFAKGNAAAKETIDRISGSGVFARDPDSLITFTRHEEERAFTLEMVLRNLPPIKPFVVQWQWPLFHREECLDPARLKQAGGRPASHTTDMLLKCLGPRLALVVGVVLFVASLALGLLAAPDLLIVMGCYIALQLLYCLLLKDQRVIDIAIIASGFLLRAVAGGAATGIELSQWFLMAASFGALFMASGKRYAESRMEGDLVAMRKPLEGYTQTYLRFIWTLSATMLTMTYALWAFDLREASGSVLPTISMAPFILAVLRYAIHVDAGEADEPEVIAWHDRILQGLGLLWLVTLALAIWR